MITSEPIIESFKLVGVNGYRSIEFKCKHNVKVVSAENGSGKTTLLNALYAILSGKYAALSKLNFSHFIIKLKDMDEMHILKSEVSKIEEGFVEDFKNEYPQLLDSRHLLPSFTEAIVGLSLGQLSEFLSSEWYDYAYHTSPYDREELLEICRSFIEEHSHKSDRTDEINSYVESGMAGASVLYLPTYRRIEAEMPSTFKKKGGVPFRRNRGVPTSRRRPSRGWSDDQLINFGLEDVETRLNEISNRIRTDTFDAYTRIGGRTLEELIDAPSNSDSNLPDFNIEELKVVLARLGKSGGTVESRVAELIESGDINKPDYAYLRAFLSQLLEVYASGKEQESAIESFVNIINSYWKNSFSEKSFMFNKEAVSADVYNSLNGKQLKLNSLSSGEKQIVSIFARLYLNENKKYIVLIDEPELSLSIDWQRRFLIDILNSPSCEQLVAITHSPFVFDNDLDPYAGSLIVSNENLI